MRDVRSREFAIPFLQRLIAVDTCNPPGNEHRLSVVLEPFLNEAGIPCEIVPLDSKRSNVTAALKGSGHRRLMFCGHMDTVSPWSASAGQYAPHGADISGNRIYGRGTSDMKSGLAAMLLAMMSLRQDGIRLDGDLLFLATAGEEVDSCGARMYLDRHSTRDLDGIVIGEPTSGKVALGHKGALWLRITLFGRSAHGSMPEFGLNAVEGMMELIGLLHRHALEWRTSDPILGTGSLSVNRIQGGVQTNVIPDRCIIDVDIRTVPPQDHALLMEEIEISLDGMKKLNPQYRYEMELLLDRSAVYTDPNDELITAALDLTGQSRGELKGVPYYTDGSVLHHDGKPPILIYGPGDEKLAHQPDEWVDIDAYMESITFYRELAIRFLGPEQA
ncbi:M20 family metallopeptidase [Paenibacillus sp. HN-1]|uniref:M20 family metallopeptidase n=1 Tax=Paenibacillus TaxID=44249 RepID=UPI001CA8CBBE|nr:MULTISPECIES: M20 family metallopeptidase [Paenibacillus]MBY9081393.1 M20 family metallopeptidase [Paenibacillus sp. CGMCC 1.18879]MBY9084913.1 M20 family metallopeptidase [Paenibacillus sinensis]